MKIKTTHWLSGILFGCVLGFYIGAYISVKFDWKNNWIHTYFGIILFLQFIILTIANKLRKDKKLEPNDSRDCVQLCDLESKKNK